MPTHVYSVAGSEGTTYYGTKREAVASARRERKAGDEYVYVVRNRVADLPRRELYVRLLNGAGWSVGHEDVSVDG